MAVITGRYAKKSFPVRVACTAAILLFYRLMSCVPLPFIDLDLAASVYGAGGVFGMLNILTGGGLAGMSFAALGVTPYITASILVEMASAVVPSLSAMHRAGEVGRRHIRKITLICSFFMALVSGFGLSSNAMAAGLLTVQSSYVVLLLTVLLAGTGTLFAWLGSCIDEHFFGNGVSLLLVTGIASSIPGDLAGVFASLSGRPHGIWLCVAFGGVLILLLVFCCWMMMCEKVYALGYSKFGGAAPKGLSKESVLRLKMLSGGVMPVIFASSFLSFPPLIASLFGSSPEWLALFNMSEWLSSEKPWASFGILIYGAAVLVFSRYSQMLSLNEMELADSLRRSDCVIAGVEQGDVTARFLRHRLRLLNRIGGICLCIVALTPVLTARLFHIQSINLLGTTMVILVSVMMDTWEAFRAEMVSLRWMADLRILRQSRRREDAFRMLERRSGHV